MSKADELDTLLRNMRTELNNSIFDPFDLGRMADYLEKALGLVAEIRDLLPALAPGKHEPEAILFPAKNKPTRPRKGH